MYKEMGKYCIIKRKQLTKVDLQITQLSELGDSGFKAVYRIICEGLGILGE